jgi:hypothetical protein
MHMHVTQVYTDMHCPIHRATLNYMSSLFHPPVGRHGVRKPPGAGAVSKQQEAAAFKAAKLVQQ